MSHGNIQFIFLLKVYNLNEKPKDIVLTGMSATSVFSKSNVTAIVLLIP